MSFANMSYLRNFHYFLISKHKYEHVVLLSLR